MIGVGIPLEHQAVLPPKTVLKQIPFEWWYDWTYANLDAPGYVPMLKNPVPGSADWIFALNNVRSTGRIWSLWNEPHDRNQMPMDPETAAAASREWRKYARFLGQPVWWVGPNIKVGSAGMEWLTEYKKAGGWKPPYLSFHIYANGPRHWRDQFDRIWQWCKDNDWLGPMWCTETSCFDYPHAKQTELVRYLINEKPRSVARWAWFSSLYGPSEAGWTNSDLFSWSTVQTEAGHQVQVGGLSPVGRQFRTLLRR